MVDPERLRRLLSVLDGYRDRLAGLRALAGLRNRLVHLYDDIDDRLVHEFLDGGLADLESFASATARLVAEGGDAN